MSEQAYDQNNLYSLKVGEGRTGVMAMLSDTGHGIHVLLTGGTTPHIGAVVLALPRPSLKQDGSVSSDCFVLPVPKHKDHIPAQLVAESIALTFDIPCAVTAGIHSDNMSTEEIELVLKNIRCLIDKIASSFVPR